MKPLLVILIAITFLSFQKIEKVLPRVFIFTDINIDAGDPDDRQSLIHLFWYANELKIEGIVPERYEAYSYKACEMAIEAYTHDFDKFKFKNYPKAEHIKSNIAIDLDHAKQLFIKAARDLKSPLYVLIWGNMSTFKDILQENPELAKNIRLITIGTGLMLEKDIPHLPKSWKKYAPCKQINWNGDGRNSIYNDVRFKDMWWLEINWTYNGMFTGEEPKQIFKTLTEFGSMGDHIKEVVKNEPWAQYFRVGDTPSVLYLIDSKHNIVDPTQSSWAGQFAHPFPKERPN